MEICRQAPSFYVVFFFSLFNLIQFATADDTVGSVPGSFSVTPSGAATYTIPIEVPPGVNGMQPELALVYNSQSGNGPLGIGWSLAGLSAIMRCPTDLARDGFVDPVDYDNNDRFCLDGQRLVLKYGTYGQHNGAVYFPEFDYQMPVTSYGFNGNGPDHWILKSSEGKVITYGGGGYAYERRIRSLDQVDSWLIREIKDLFGNAVTFYYDYDQSQGLNRISSIVYAAGSLHFEYEDRTDQTEPFGLLFQVQKRLSKVRIKNHAGGEIAYYDFAYEYSSATDRSVLTSISRCVTNEGCLKPTLLTASKGSKDFFDFGIPTLPSWWHGYEVIGQGDFNGDGLSDLYLNNPDNLGSVYGSIWYGKADGGFELYGIPTLPSWWNGYKILGQGDFNGDGLSDLYLNNPDNLGSVYGHIWYGGDRTQPDLTTAISANDLPVEIAYGPGPQVINQFSAAGSDESMKPFSVPLVTDTAIADGVGGFIETSYAYQDFKFQTKGLGSLGFQSITETNQTTGITTQTTYSQDWQNRTVYMDSPGCCKDRFS